MSAPRYILRCFVLLGVVVALIGAASAAISGYWPEGGLGLAWAAIGLAIFMGPNDAFANARLRWRRWRRRTRRA